MSMLTRWQPFREMRREMRRFRREMGDFFGRRGLELPEWSGAVISYPPVNFSGDGDFVYAEAELPGLRLQDIEVTVADNQLTLKGKREPSLPAKAEWHRRERTFGSFERALTLPESVDPAKVEARLENGVLTIKMAKHEMAKSKRITVKAE
jgi:HSP20 family protein